MDNIPKPVIIAIAILAVLIAVFVGFKTLGGGKKADADKAAAMSPQEKAMLQGGGGGPAGMPGGGRTPARGGG